MIALSTREMMRLVILAAANLLLYKGAWMILIYAPVGIVAAVLNVGLFCTFVRPRTLNRGIAAALLAGILVAMAAAAYLADSRGSGPAWPSRSSSACPPPCTTRSRPR